MARRDKIEEEILNLISDHFLIPKEEIDMKTNFMADLSADSLDSIDMVMKLETNFDVMISDEEADKIMTVENTVDLIINKLYEKESFGT